MVRYPKASAGPDIEAVNRVGALDVLAAHGHDVLIVAVGVMARPCMEGAAELASHGVGVTVVSPDWVLPVDPALLKLAGRFETVVTVEDAARGVGGAITRACADARITATVRTLGPPGRVPGPRRSRCPARPGRAGCPRNQAGGAGPDGRRGSRQDGRSGGRVVGELREAI